jgi:HSP20 family molecular chaperone IbpA
VKTDELIRWDPFAEMTRLNEALQRYLSAWEREFPAQLESGFTPLGAMEEAEDAFELEIALPGIERDDVQVELIGRRLRVVGERPEREGGGGRRRPGRCERHTARRRVDDPPAEGRVGAPPHRRQLTWAVFDTHRSGKRR